MSNFTTPDSPIKLTTRFGEFEAAPDTVIAFADGLPGFERCRRFVVLRQSGPSPLMCLHAIEGAAASFLTIEPRHVVRGYQVVLSDADRLRLGAAPGAPLLCLAIITIGSDEELFVNLRAPIVISPERLVGLQAISHDTAYPLRYRLDAERLALTGTDGPPCLL